MITINGILRRKKPVFRRHDTHKKSRINKSWRKPNGLHNKLRLSKRGHGKSVKVGYGTTKIIRGFHLSGLMPVNVNNVEMLKDIDAKTQGIIIGKSVGQRKKVEIINNALDAGLKIFNVKDVNAYLDKVKKLFEDKKKDKETKIKVKEDKKKKAEEAAKKKESEKKPALTLKIFKPASNALFMISTFFL